MPIEKPVKRADKPKRTSKSQDDLEQRRLSYARLFNTSDGKVVLADLERLFYESAMAGTDLNREVGKRDVVHFIKQQVKNYDR